MARRVIKLLGEPIQNEDDKAAEAITPGHLVTFNGSGNLIKHNVADGLCAKAFALEREEAGQDIDTAYAVDDYVKVGVFPPGTRVNAIVGSGVSVAKGATLASAGNGKLKAGSSNVVGRALETVAATADTRVRVEIM